MRVVAKKRPKFMTLHRWIFVIVATVLLAGMAIALYFRDIQQPQWTGELAAEQRAAEEAGVAVVDQVYHHVWHQDAWIVQGFNQEDEEVFVWLLDETEPFVMKAADGLSNQDIENKFDAEHEDAVLDHIQPGLFDGKPVWEVFYHLEAEQKRYFYEFYSFESGALVERYQLPGKTEP
jgi:uncharacterized protein YpmB